jgi:hypothetical protein
MRTRCNEQKCINWATHVRMINGVPVVFCLPCAWALDKK